MVKIWVNWIEYTFKINKINQSPLLFVGIGIQTTDRPNQKTPLYLSGWFNELECLGGGRVLISR